MVPDQCIVPLPCMVLVPDIVPLDAKGTIYGTGSMYGSSTISTVKCLTVLCLQLFVISTKWKYGSIWVELEFIVVYAFFMASSTL